MVRSEFLCSPEEFWLRVSRAIDKYEFVLFARHQKTGQFSSLSPSADYSFDSFWNVWLSKADPDEDPKLTPAEQGWILLVPPSVNHAAFQISESGLGAQTRYLTACRNELRINESLAAITKSVIRDFLKGTIRAEVTVVGKYRTDIEKKRYTSGAIELQRNGWSFCAMGGVIIKLPFEL